MKEKLEEIRSKGLKKIEEVKKLEDLQEVTREITGKKSELTEALKSLSELSIEMKKTIGMQATEIKKVFADKLKEKEDELKVDASKLQDPDYIARYAREKYSYSKDGEIILRIP